MNHKTLLLLSLSLLAAGAGLRDARAQTSNRTVLTYQGVLKQDGAPANGPVDMTWRIYDAETNGNLIAEGQVSQVPVQDGLFTLPMELPALGDNALPPPDGSPAGTWWMEFCLRFPTVPGCRLMSPRQRVSPTVQALSARIASTVRDGAVTAAKLATGAVNTSSLQNGAVTAAKIGSNQVVGSINDLRDNVVLAAGPGLTLNTFGNTVQFAAAPPDCTTYSNCFWNLRGNGNIGAGVHFLGTVLGELDPLDFRVNNLRGLRLQPDNGPFVCDTVSGTMADAQSPSLVGGYFGNFISPGVAGSVISGGGADDYFCLGGNLPLPNLITAPMANIGGGLGNEVRGAISTVGGGYLNRIEHSANYCVIAGGGGNLISSAGVVASAADGSTISGGSSNEIRDDSNASTISGGSHNLIESNINFATIGGGEANKLAGHYATVSGGYSNIVSAWGGTIGGGVASYIYPGATYSTVGGGQNNYIRGGDHNTISGGDDNQIEGTATLSTIGGGEGNGIARPFSFIGGGSNNTVYAAYATTGGGEGNFIQTNADYSTISGGKRNRIMPDAHDSAIGGGEGNLILPRANHSTIGGGIGNIIWTNAYFSTIGGGQQNSIDLTAPWSVLGGGTLNRAQSDYATVGGGDRNEVQLRSDHASIAGGRGNVVTNAPHASIGGGATNTVTAAFATVPGGTRAVASHYGQVAHASGRFANDGDAQTSLYVLRRTTTTAAPAELFLDGVGQRMVLPVDSTWTFQVMVAARTDGGTSGGWIIQGVIKRQANVTELVSPPNVTPLSNVEGGIGTVTVEADNINEALVIRVAQGTPSIGAVRWVASTRTTEVIF